MWLFFLALQVLGLHTAFPFVEEFVKLFDISPFDAFVFTQIGLWNSVAIDNVVKLARIA